MGCICATRGFFNDECSWPPPHWHVLFATRVCSPTPVEAGNNDFSGTELTNPGAAKSLRLQKILVAFTRRAAERLVCFFFFSFLFFTQTHCIEPGGNYGGRLSRIMNANFHRRRKSARRPRATKSGLEIDPADRGSRRIFRGTVQNEFHVVLVSRARVRHARVSRNTGERSSIRAPSFSTSATRNFFSAQISFTGRTLFGTWSWSVDPAVASASAQPLLYL